MDRTDEDDIMSFGDSNSYCNYYQRRGHAANKCKSLEASILGLIA